MISLGEFIFIMFLFLCTLQLTYKGAYYEGYTDCDDEWEMMEYMEEEDRVNDMYTEYIRDEARKAASKYKNALKRGEEPNGTGGKANR